MGGKKVRIDFKSFYHLYLRNTCTSLSYRVFRTRRRLSSRPLQRELEIHSVVSITQIRGFNCFIVTYKIIILFTRLKMTCSCGKTLRVYCVTDIGRFVSLVET